LGSAAHVGRYSIADHNALWVNRKTLPGQSVFYGHGFGFAHAVLSKKLAVGVGIYPWLDGSSLVNLRICLSRVIPG